MDGNGSDQAHSSSEVLTCLSCQSHFQESIIDYRETILSLRRNNEDQSELAAHKTNNSVKEIALDQVPLLIQENINTRFAPYKIRSNLRNKNSLKAFTSRSW